MEYHAAQYGTATDLIDRAIVADMNAKNNFIRADTIITTCYLLDIISYTEMHNYKEYLRKLGYIDN